MTTETDVQALLTRAYKYWDNPYVQEKASLIRSHLKKHHTYKSVTKKESEWHQVIWSFDSLKSEIDRNEERGL